MTCTEFSNQFDVLYNNITSSQAPGLNEYEKSVFLTKAQNQLVNEYFNVRTDGFGGGFDGSQRRQYDFSSLVLTKQLTEDTAVLLSEKTDRRSRVFLFPDDYFLTVNETVYDSHYQYTVIPVSYAEYQKLMLKPYSYPVKRGVWRLLTSVTTDTVPQSRAELIGRFYSSSEALDYQLRYVKTLSPVILEDLSNYGDGITILGKTAVTECKLPAECHEEILERAVTLAKIAWQGSTATQASSQQREQ